MLEFCLSIGKLCYEEILDNKRYTYELDVLVVDELVNVKLGTLSEETLPFLTMSPPANITIIKYRKEQWDHFNGLGLQVT